MTTADFIRKHNACHAGAKWALSVSPNMSAVWDELVKQGKHAWLLWTATRPGVFPDSTLRKLACRFVRETPLRDGRTVWDLLEDERSRNAVEISEAYADGKATEAELDAAYYAADAACAASYAYASAAFSAARAAARVAAFSATWTNEAAAWTAEAAARDAADAAARSAQVRMFAELGNPFKEGKPDEH